MGDFSTQLRAFADKAIGNAEKVVKKVVFDLGTAIVYRNPVGNPNLWQVNHKATKFNANVAQFNAISRTRPENLTKAGHLKRGLKLNAKLPIKSPGGYVGGRSRNSWMYSFNAPNDVQPHPMSQDYAGDKTGGESIGRLQAVLSEPNVFGVHYITNNLPYMDRLEHGWSKQAPAGMVRVSVAEFQRFITAAVESLPK